MRNWLGRTPEQQKAWDEAYGWWATWMRVACIFIPAPFLYPAWDWMIENLGYEGAAGVTMISQIACVMLIPDRVAAFMADRAAHKR
jgi:hypothetical protein